ncbi:MAG: 23S rRNA (pseudouridine(1915)-N(3))-methyltransferase RlmH [Thiohalomonadales bacterium]|nr:23S rRNA (pseudouridine(1915)-N(3))-methyltransferase RlmH [Thiohalomonadales bacterium]
MQIHLIAVGNRMPDWVSQGYEEFARRMPPECRLNLVEIPAAKRTKAADIRRLLSQEGERMLEAIPKHALIITLDVSGQRWDTEQLSQQLDSWMHEGRDIALLIGGPEGLAPNCQAQAERSWSLSPLTFPHPLVRIIVAEQLYRATTILKHHPYHK